MFCSSCGKMIDDDSIFCRVCGKRVKPLPENDSSSTGKISLEKSIDIPITENETPYINEDNLQPESSDDTTEEVSAETPEDNKSFFGSTEPIEHINPEPLPENPLSEKIPEKHTRETLPDLVLRKKVQTQPEDLSEEDFPTDDSQEDYEDYNDNSDTQYIPYEEIQENPNNNYNPPPVYNPPPYNPPQYPEEQPYFNPPPPKPVPPPAPVENNRPKQVGTLRLFGAGTVTIFTMLLVLLLSLLFCIKLGFSGAVLEKSIKGLDNEKVLDAEYDGNHDVNDFLYEKTNFYNITFGTASENDFRNFLLNLDMKYFIAENVSVYADYLLNGGRKPTLTSENITEYMFNKSGYNNLIRQDFSSMIYNLTDGQADEILSVDSWEKHTGFDSRISGYIFSYITLIIILAFICVLIIWIYAIVNMRMRYMMSFCKFIFITSGVVLLLTGAVGVIAPPIVYSQTSHITFYLLSKLLKDFNLFTLTTGGFEFIVGIIFGLIRKLVIIYERKTQI